MSASDHERATLTAIAVQLDLYAAEADRNAVLTPERAEYFKGVGDAARGHATIVREQAARGEWPTPTPAPPPPPQRVGSDTGIPYPVRQAPSP